MNMLRLNGSYAAMGRSRHSIYNLEEASKLTGYAQPTLRRAINDGDLATTGSEEAPCISGVELERWWRGVEGRARELFPPGRS